MPTDKLKEFRVNHPHQAQSCLDDMFDWWLKNGEKPTHSQLAEALSDIGRRDLTMKIRSQEVGQMLQDYFRALHLYYRTPRVTIIYGY